jgi:hypothetical protein
MLSKARILLTMEGMKSRTLRPLQDRKKVDSVQSQHKQSASPQ